MTKHRYDLMSLGIIAIDDRVLYKGNKFVVSDLNTHKGLTTSYHGTISYDLCDSISITNLEEGTITFSGYDRLNEFIINSSKLDTSDKDYSNKIYKGKEIKVISYSDKHAIITTKRGQQIIKTTDLSKVIPVGFKAKFVIKGTSSYSNPIYEIIKIYEEDNPLWSDWCLVVGKFIGFYKQNQAYYGSGVNEYSNAREDAFIEVMKETANLSPEKLTKSNRITEKYEYKHNFKKGDLEVITRIRKSSLGITNEKLPKLKYDRDLFKKIINNIK